MMDAFFKENGTFRSFTGEHLAVLLFGGIFFFLVIRYARKLTPERQVLIGAILSYTVIITYFLVFISIDAIRHGFDPNKHLPFAMCNVCGVTLWLVLHKKNFLAYEVLFFWIMSGTLAACLTPEIKQSFPHYTFFAFWTIHLGLVGSALYATFVFRMRPGFKSLVKAFIALNIYAVAVGCINWFLRLLGYADANYFYVCHKPDVWTPLNWFGEWPWYLFWGQLFAAGIFMLIYLPFFIHDLVLGPAKGISDRRATAPSLHENQAER